MAMRVLTGPSTNSDSLAVWQGSHGAEECKGIILYRKPKLLICYVFENGGG
jgi:hypothetical protein